MSITNFLDKIKDSFIKSFNPLQEIPKFTYFERNYLKRNSSEDDKLKDFIGLLELLSINSFFINRDFFFVLAHKNFFGLVNETVVDFILNLGFVHLESMSSKFLSIDNPLELYKDIFPHRYYCQEHNIEITLVNKDEFIMAKDIFKMLEHCDDDVSQIFIDRFRELKAFNQRRETV